MKLLTFLSSSFTWKPDSERFESGSGGARGDSVRDAVVVFFQAEEKDEGEEARKRALRHVLKHIKWLANKRGFRTVVLHSFGHLGASKSAPEFAASFQGQVAERLSAGGYEVTCTPFGWSCSWDLSVEGDTLAKVWKEI